MSPKQLRAAELLSEGRTQQEIADTIGVSRRTVIRWCQDANFKNLAFGLRNRSQPQPQPTNITPIREKLESLSDWNLDDPSSREQAHQELRKLEWKISIAILQKALSSLENIEFSRPRDLMNCVEIASNLGRKAGEIFDGDMNAAIYLLRRLDFDIVDRQAQNLEDETDESIY